MKVYEFILAKCIEESGVEHFFGNEMHMLKLFHMEHHTGDFYKVYKVNHLITVLHGDGSCDNMLKCCGYKDQPQARHYIYRTPTAGNAFVLHHLTNDGWTDYIIAYKGDCNYTVPMIEDILRQCNGLN